MGFAEESSASWEAYEHASDALKGAIDKLKERSGERQQQDYGLSEGFNHTTIDPEIAMSLCERAIENLADRYVDSLTAFREAADPNDALQSLEEAEIVWHSESRVIGRFDAEGGELSFLLEMRVTTLQVLENKLEEASESCSRDATPENIALCIGILAIMDQILDEKGIEIQAPQRQRFRSIAKSFK